MRIMFSGRPFYGNQYAQLKPTGAWVVTYEQRFQRPCLRAQDPLKALVTFALCTTTGPIFEGGVVCCVYITHT